MQLRRGHIILFTGAAITVTSLATFVYLLTDNIYSIQPNDRLIITRFITNASEGVYNISFPLFEGQARIEITGPANQTIVEQDIKPPIVSEIFTVLESGNYTLFLMNQSPDVNLQASILFGNRDSFATQEQVIFSFLLYVGIIALIAGAVITILDWRRSNKMRQYGDTSDLV